MKKLIALVKSNFLIQKNTFLDEEPKKLKKRIISMVMMGIFLLCSMEVYVSKAIDLTSAAGIESKYIFYSVIALEIGIVSFLSLYRIINSFYLTNSWKDIFIYPVKDGVVLLSKFILACYQNLVIAAAFLIPLITYGILMKLSIGYYLKLISYQILIIVIPAVYITLVSLTILWIITVIKKSKVKNRANKFILLIDIFVGILIDTSIINIELLIINLSLAAIVSIIGLYFIGGSVYLTIMRSEVFTSKKDKIVEEDADGYKFEKMNQVKSSIVKDLRMLKREKSLKTNCLTTNFIFSLICLVLILELGQTIDKAFDVFGIAGNAIFFTIFVWPLSIGNCTAATSFSREGSGLKLLRTFPIEKDKYIISKFCTAVITYIPLFVVCNITIFKMAKDIIQFAILELLTITQVILMIMVNMKMDSENISLGWNDIKELFELERVLKLTKPVNIAYVILFPCFLIMAFCFKEQMNNYFIVIILIAANVLISVHDLKKVRESFKLKI